MAPVLKTASFVARTALSAGLLQSLQRRDLSVDSTQKVTLGIIAVYVVVIALLWNIPYVRGVLWPFKVGQLSNLTCGVVEGADFNFTDARHCVSRIRTCDYGNLYWRAC
jgi:hypothetical protein